MKISEVKSLLGAEVLCGDDKLDIDVCSAFACDLMSDVLAFANNQGILISGLVNPQVVRTAEMMDMTCILFVRGKRPDVQVIELAKQKEIPMMATEYTMYESCGLLYKAGLLP